MADTNAMAGDLMGVVRECFYAPDGKAPDGYDDARDFKMLRYWLSKGGDPQEIEYAIRGFAQMRDDGELRWIQQGEKITLRALNPKVSKHGEHPFRTGANYWRKHLADESRRRKRKSHGMVAASESEIVAALVRAQQKARGAA